MSLYRVSTANTYDRTQLNIQQRQQQLAISQEQLSSGKRVAKASDDSVAATLSERTMNRLSRTEVDLRGVEASRRSLAQAESALTSATDLYTRFKELTVQAGNGVLNASDRRTIALEMRGIREQLIELSNQRDTVGKALFAGLGPVNADGQAFAEQVNTPVVATYGPDGRTVQWVGTQGQEAPTESTLPSAMDGYGIFKGGLPGSATAIADEGAPNSNTAQAVSVSVVGTLNTTDVFTLTGDATPQGSYAVTFDNPGYSVTRTPKGGGPAVAVGAVGVVTSGIDTTVTFEGLSLKLKGTPTATDVFTLTPAVDSDVWETMDRAIGALETGETNFDLSQELSVVHLQMAGRLDQLLSARGKLGDWLNRADNMDMLFSDRAVAYQQENSELTDVDMVDAVTDFETNQAAYQAALQSYAQIQKMSMFDYLR